MASAPSTPPGRDDAASKLRVPLLVTLLLSAAGAFFVQPRVIAAVRAEQLPATVIVVAPALFAIVVALAAVDAWRAARRRGYFRGPSVVMLAAAVAFLGLLVPNTVEEYRARTSPPVDSVAHYDALFTNNDPRVRALVMEAAGFRPGPAAPVTALLLKGLDDGDPMVVQSAMKAIEHRAGTPIADVDAAKKAAAALR